VTAWRGGRQGAADQPGQGAADESLSREPLTGGGHAALQGRVEPAVLAGGNVNARGGHLVDTVYNWDAICGRAAAAERLLPGRGQGAEDIILGLEAPEAEEWLVARLGST
jgi:hypothetical protein